MLFRGVVTDIFRIDFNHLLVFWCGWTNLIKCICPLSNGFWGRYQKGEGTLNGKGYTWSRESITSKHSALTWAIFSSVISLVWMFIEQRLPVLLCINLYHILYLIEFSIFSRNSGKIFISFEPETAEKIAVFFCDLNEHDERHDMCLSVWVFFYRDDQIRYSSAGHLEGFLFLSILCNRREIGGYYFGRPI